MKNFSDSTHSCEWSEILNKGETGGQLWCQSIEIEIWNVTHFEGPINPKGLDNQMILGREGGGVVKTRKDVNQISRFYSVTTPTPPFKKILLIWLRTALTTCLNNLKTNELHIIVQNSSFNIYQGSFKFLCTFCMFFFSLLLNPLTFLS